MYNSISGETVTYTYDSLNRIATASGSGWGEAYTFDPFGNLTEKTVTSGSGPSLSVPVDPNHNQIEGLGGYDANGNTFTASAAHDVENHIYALVGESPYTSYSYDAQNKRVFTYTSGSVDTYGNPINYLVVLYAPSGQKLGMYQISTCNTNALCSLLMTSDQYFGERRLASMDQLGSVGTYYPWGEAKGTTNPQDTWSYATYWRDSATGLDYANNRYYTNAYGRFMTPDPYVSNNGSAGNPSDPQSWNKYAYTRGDPVNRLDPRGLDDEPTCTTTSSDFCITITDTSDDESKPAGQVNWGGDFTDLYLPMVQLNGDPGDKPGGKPPSKDFRKLKGPECDKTVIDAMEAAWQKTANGTQNGAEAGFIVKGTPGNYTIVALPIGTGCAIGFPAALLNGAVALFHVHPNNCLPTLSTADMGDSNLYHIPIYAESRSGLWEFNPGDNVANKGTQIAQFLQWTQPCPTPNQ